MRASSAQAALQRFQAFAWPQPSTIGLTILLAVLSFVVLAPLFLFLVSGVQVEGACHVVWYRLATWRACFPQPCLANTLLTTFIATLLGSGTYIPLLSL